VVKDFPAVVVVVAELEALISHNLLK